MNTFDDMAKRYGQPLTTWSASWAWIKLQLDRRRRIEDACRRAIDAARKYGGAKR